MKLSISNQSMYPDWSSVPRTSRAQFESLQPLRSVWWEKIGDVPHITLASQSHGKRMSRDGCEAFWWSDQSSFATKLISCSRDLCMRVRCTASQPQCWSWQSARDPSPTATALPGPLQRCSRVHCNYPRLFGSLDPRPTRIAHQVPRT